MPFVSISARSIGSFSNEFLNESDFLNSARSGIPTHGNPPAVDRADRASVCSSFRVRWTANSVAVNELFPVLAPLRIDARQLAGSFAALFGAQRAKQCGFVLSSVIVIDDTARFAGYYYISYISAV